MKRLLFLLLCTLALHTHALSVVDDRGIEVTLPKAPQRIVSLLPSLTEIVCELGACDRLVGVDNYSNWPQAVDKLPRVGGLEDANIEIIVSLRPDVVLLSVSSRAMARLEGLGLKVVALEPKTMADVQRVMGKVGQVLQVPGAPQLWERIDNGATCRPPCAAPRCTSRSTAARTRPASLPSSAKC